VRGIVKSLRACSVGMVLFRLATVSIVKRGLVPF